MTPSWIDELQSIEELEAFIKRVCELTPKVEKVDTEYTSPLTGDPPPIHERPRDHPGTIVLGPSTVMPAQSGRKPLPRRNSSGQFVKRR